MLKSRFVKLVRGLAAAIAGLGCLAMVVPAAAQMSIPAPPVFTAIDANGVDVSSGKFNVSQLSATIGPAEGGLAYVYRGPAGRDSFAGTVNSAAGTLMGNPVTYYTVSIGGSSVTFLRNSGAATIGSFIGTIGQSLTYDAGTGLYTHTALDGTVAVFSTALTSTLPNAANAGNIISLTRPSGERLTYAYKVCGTGCQRLQSVTSNRGYMIKYEYSSGAVLSRVTALNAAIDACDPTADACSFSRVWPSLSFAPAADGSSLTITDALTRSTIYGLTGVKITSIQRPGVNAVAIVYNAADRVQSVSNGVGTWTYTYTNYAGGEITPGYTGAMFTRVTDPQSHTRTVNTNLASGQVISETNAAGAVTSYSYLPNDGRVERIMRPEGNSVVNFSDYTTYGDYTSYKYTGANLTEVRRVAKRGAGLPDIVITANYAESNACNPKTCHKPISVTDERGNVTSYTYDATHGGVLTVTSPAPTSGAVQPQARISYSSLQAWYKNAAGTLVAGSPIYLPVATSQCATAAACSDAADEVKTTVSYQAGSASLASNLLPLATISGAGNGSLSATTAMTYDPYGNVATVDGPLAGSADTTRTYYDLMRQAVGAIGPDPDGADALLYRASRTTYNPNGQVTLVESGTATNQSDTGMSTFTPLDSAQTIYDDLGRKISDRLVVGGGIQSRTDYDYDLAGRPTCQIVRMYPTASRPATACTPTLSGPDGADRITYIQYDVADRVNQVTTGYGVDPQIEKTVTYTDNGLEKTVADGKGNLTTYEYDGFDRLVKVRYPNASGGGSSTTDYDGYCYDEAGNRKTWRQRHSTAALDCSVATFTYDALNRAQNGLRGEAYAYDNLDRRTSATYAGQTASAAFDALGRLTSETTNSTTNSRTMAYEYDPAGNRTKITWPDTAPTFYVIYKYDSAGAITEVRENGASLLATYSYDDLGRIKSLVRPNGLTTSYGYDAASRLTCLSHTVLCPGTGGTWRFDYNAASQVKARTANDTRYEWSAGQASKTYTVNGLNQYDTVGGTTMVYDHRGNLTNDGATAYGYDLLNNLTSAGTASLAYEPSGRLWSVTSGATTTQFLYSGSDLVAEMSPSGQILRRYVPGAGTDAPIVWYEGSGTGDRRWLLTDPQGSIVGVTSASGVEAWTNTYDEYGVPAAGNVGRFQYTGQAWIPEVGLYHYKARAYSPTLGRFLQTDPIGYVDGMNWYAYVGNDSINYADPSGLTGGIEDARGQTPTPVGGVTVTGCASGAICLSGQAAYQFGQDMSQASTMVSEVVVPWLGRGADTTAGFFIPGYDLYRCTEESCSDGEGHFNEEGYWALVGLVPELKFLKFLKLGKFGKLGRLCNCFEAGTMVATADGPKAIEDVKVGDLVLSRDEITGQTAQKPVAALIPGKERQIWDVTVAVEATKAAPRRETIHTTEEHPFHTADGAWTPAAKLTVGAKVVTASGTATVVSVVRTDRVVRTYNLEIEGFHTYFVGNEQVWVHNSCLEGFIKVGGATKNTVKNLDRLAELRGIGGRNWHKVYQDGWINGEKVSHHYFQDEAGVKAFEKIVGGWSNKH